MPDARTAILTRIREQLGAAVPALAAGEYDDLARAYTQHGTLPAHESIELLLERLVDYDAEVIEAEESEIANVILAVLARRQESVLLVPPGVPEAWLPSGAEPQIEILRDGNDGKGGGASLLPLATLARAHAVLTTCAGAIAATGTLLLVHSDPAQGRRVLTLLPDHHLCILRRSQVVETVAEGLALAASQASSAITTISGPSATADIEMTRIRGVHGPRRLTVLLVS